MIIFGPPADTRVPVHSSHSRNSLLRIPLLSGCIALFALWIELTPSLAANLQFDRAAIRTGEWWRLLTGHLTHFGTDHLTWDVVVLIAFGAFCEAQSRRQTALVIAAASITISLLVWWCQPEFILYRGLSGIDCALFGMFTASLGRRRNIACRCLASIATATVIGKCFFEVATHSTLFASGNGYLPVPLAHGAGFVTGVSVSWVCLSPALRAVSTRIFAPPTAAQDLVSQ